MKLQFFKKRAIKKMLSMLGFTSSAFVFAACYGPIPEKYQDEEYVDSVRAAFENQDSLTIVNASDDKAADDLLHHEDAFHSPDNSGNTYN